MKGTTLTRVKRATDEVTYAGSSPATASARRAVGDRAPYTYLFKRILL